MIWNHKLNTGSVPVHPNLPSVIFVLIGIDTNQPDVADFGGVTVSDIDDLTDLPVIVKMRKDTWTIFMQLSEMTETILFLTNPVIQGYLLSLYRGALADAIERSTQHLN